MQTCRGSCHCNAVRFEIDADIEHVRSCDCSICAKRAALMVRVAPKHFRLQTPLDEMTTYRWGMRTGADYFCRTCGVLPFRTPSAPTPEEIANGVEPSDGWAINARCLEEFDPESVPMCIIPGRALIIPARPSGKALHQRDAVSSK
jgi:hypothetical protein